MVVFNTILVIGLVYASTIVRMLYGMTLKLKGKVFVDAAICSGAGHPSILFRHTPLAASRRYIEDRVEHIACVSVALSGMLAAGEFGPGHGGLRSDL
jgi:ABC-type dipeptide/oligopeptide/nickel transport system permease subunit